MIITIDGPAGAGKSTIARELAHRLGFEYLDTGAMYRALTLKALRAGLDPEDVAALGTMAEASEIREGYDPSLDPPWRIYLDGEDVTSEIRSREVSANVSRVSAHKAVREEMVRKQRNAVETGDLVVEGRDAGTVVFPDADMKFFLTATAEVRAVRRFRELHAGGHRVSLEEVRKEIEERDEKDSTREADPLRPAPDARLVDTSGLSVEQVVNLIYGMVRSRGGGVRD